MRLRPNANDLFMDKWGMTLSGTRTMGPEPGNDGRTTDMGQRSLWKAGGPKTIQRITLWTVEDAYF